MSFEVYWSLLLFYIFQMDPRNSGLELHIFCSCYMLAILDFFGTVSLKMLTNLDFLSMKTKSGFMLVQADRNGECLYLMSATYQCPHSR